MLVLSRKVGEKVVFPELGITIVVTKIRGNITQLGIEAPSEVKILRGELVKDDPPPQPQEEAA